MSRREDRDSDPRRHRSRFDREPSPSRKKSRREGRSTIEKSETCSRVDQDPERHSRLRNALPLEIPSAPKAESGGIKRETDKKANGNHDRTKHSSDPREIPRSRSYFQHDERGKSGQGYQRSASERGWWRDPKDRKEEAAANTEATDNRQHKDDKSQVKKDDKWRHDGFYEMEAGPSRKRRTFSEKKIPADSDKVEKGIPEHTKPRNFEQPMLRNEKREERSHSSRHLDSHEKPFARDRVLNSEARRGLYPSRERYVGGNSGNHRGGRDGFIRREERHPSNTPAEKWEHDLFFIEANRSPTPKNEEEQIAKVEELLAS